MDIAILGKNSIKIKGKQATFIVDPTKEMSKTPADAILLLNGSAGMDVSRVIESRIIIDGQGGYEISKVKISGTRTPKGILYKFSVDNMNIILGSAADTKTEGFNASDVVIVNTDSDFNESFVTSLEPKMAILYGDKKSESAKTLGAENASLVSKITITKDKLPEKTEVVVLG